MTSPTLVMTINDVQYVESTACPRVAGSKLGACLQCAFFRDSVGCLMACDDAAPRAFGGDCVQRDVIYVYAEQGA